MNRPLALIAALALALPLQASALTRAGELFNFGKKVADANQEITQEQEIEMGRGIAANLLGAAPLVDDPELQRYVNRIGLWLALQTERPDLPWRFGVMDSPNVNAFAMPGGTILITRGLYDRLRDEAELAGVLAHEISHVLRKHQLQAIKKEMGKAWQQEIASHAINSSDSAVVARFGDKAFKAGTEVFARGLDKADEYQADQLGMVIAARAGYNPFGLAGVLQTLDATSAQDDSVALMFATHPTAASRIERLDAAVGTSLDRYADTATPGRLYRPK
jgi:predicted Zn-dependent protease